MIEKLKPITEIKITGGGARWVPESTAGKAHYEYLPVETTEITCPLTPTEEKINEIIDYLNGKEGK